MKIYNAVLRQLRIGARYKVHHLALVSMIDCLMITYHIILAIIIIIYDQKKPLSAYFLEAPQRNFKPDDIHILENGKFMQKSMGGCIICMPMGAF